MKICPNQCTDLFKSLFTGDSWKIKKGLELVSRPYFSYNFLIKTFFCNFTGTGQISLSDCVYFPSCSLKWHLNTWKVKIWLSHKRKELSKWNKNHFSLFHKCSLLDIQNKLAKMQRTQPLMLLLLIWNHVFACWFGWDIAEGSHKRR